MDKILKTLIVNFNDDDIETLRKFFKEDSGIIISGIANKETKAIEEFKKELADIVIINGLNNGESAIQLIDEIKAITDDKNPPFIVLAHYTEQMATRKDPCSNAVADIGISIHRYGAEHNVQNIIDAIYTMFDYIRNDQQRKEAGIVWKCEVN